MKMVLVSVIMSACNYEKYVGEAIESILNQTFGDLELIIVEDCSKDNTKAIIQQYSEKDPRVKAFFHEKNMGISRTINDGIKHVNGKFVCFTDADDVWELHKLEKQLEVLSRNKGKLVWSEAIIIDGNGSPTGGTVTQLLNTRRKSGDLFEDLLREQFVMFQSLIFDSKFLVGLQRDETLKYVNDHRFLIDLAKNREFVFMDEPLVRYRIHGRNISSKDTAGWMRERIAIRKFFLRQFSGSISKLTRADIYYKLGHAYSNLDGLETAQYYYLKAFLEDHLHLNSVLYLTLALTANNKLINELSAKLYYSLSSYLSNKISRRRTAID